MSEATSCKRKRKSSSSFMKRVRPDKQLAAIIGQESVPRMEITRRLWEYIRAHQLQDATNKMFINADDNLRKIFGGRDQVTLFEMTKLVFAHTH
jgi:chromatin remodeling complex protein RSC6